MISLSLGVLLGVFGAACLVSTPFTDDPDDRSLAIAIGVILCAIGAVFLIIDYMVE